MITLHTTQRVIQSQDEERFFLSAISNWQLNTRPTSWHPPVDVFESDKFIIIRMEIAGMKESDFRIGVSKNMVSISGVRVDRTPRDACHQLEIYFGEFSAEISISIPFKVDSVEALYSDGFLQITLPKED